MQLDTARIFVDDLPAARAFYRDTLGLPLTVDAVVAGWCVFKSGSAGLVVEAVSADAPADEQALVGRFTGLSFTVDDVHATAAALAARGVVFTGAPELQVWGGTLATLLDTAGNALQIVQLPPMPTP